MDSLGWTLTGPWLTDTTASGSAVSAWKCGISGVEVVTKSPRSQYRQRREHGGILSVVTERASRLLDVGSTCACSSRSVNPESGCGALSPTVKCSASPTDWRPGWSHPPVSAFLPVLCRHSPRRMAERDFYNFGENPRVSLLSTRDDTAAVKWRVIVLKARTLGSRYRGVLGSQSKRGGLGACHSLKNSSPCFGRNPEASFLR